MLWLLMACEPEGASEPSPCHPVEEVCDGLDNDCDGEADEGIEILEVWVDGDGDGIGAGEALRLCGAEGQAPAGHSLVEGDCDDEDAGRNPALAEVCDDGRDQDCDGLVDCEDGDCPLCAEDCEDDEDDDLDGLTDCDDPDCLCVEGTAWVDGGEFWTSWYQEAFSWSYVQVYGQGHVSMDTGAVCTWSWVFSAWPEQEVAPADVHLDEACPMPAFTRPRVHVVGTLDVVTDQGEPWYRGDADSSSHHDHHGSSRGGVDPSPPFEVRLMAPAGR